MSSQGNSILTLTFKASGGVGASRAIGFGGAQATVAGQKVLGVSVRATADGAYSDADVAGTTIVETGGTFAAGASLVVDTSGRAVAASALAIKTGATPVTSTEDDGAAIFSGADLPQFVFADALEESTGVGQFRQVLLRR